jgi:hypothetical protein
LESERGGGVRLAEEKEGRVMIKDY